MIIEFPDGKVWITFSNIKGEDIVVHGVFTSEELADSCAAEVKRRYLRRDAYVGAWTIDQATPSISDGHLR